MELKENQAENMIVHYIANFGKDLVKNKISLSEFDKLSVDLKFALYFAINNFKKNEKGWYERIPKLFDSIFKF